MNLVRHIHTDPALRDKAAMKKRSGLTCNLALPDVQQMKNTNTRLTDSRTVPLPSGTKAKWNTTAEWHEAALQQSEKLEELSGELHARKRHRN